MAYLLYYRDRAGLSQTELARRAGTSGQQIGRLERSERKLTAEWAARLAPHLGCAPAALLYGPGDLVAVLQDVGGEVSAVRPARPIPVVGHVQAGEWREALEWPPEARYLAEYYDERYAAGDLIGLEVQGDSMDRVYPPGTVVICRSFDPQHEMPPVGRHVVVQRRAAYGVEATVKRLETDDHGRGWLVPYSSNDGHERIAYQPNGDGDEDVQITAIVVGSYRRE